MKIVLAIGTGGADIVRDLNYPNILISYAYAQEIDKWPYQPDYFILDSGAFTAWSLGKQVDVRALGAFAQRRSELWPSTITVNLDVIPGEKGRTSTRTERLDGMRKSVANADYLRSLGLRVMEVFHQDEPMSFLYELADRRQPGEVLGISPRNDVTPNQKLEWQNNVFAALVRHCGHDAFPPCHGLAVTTDRLMRAFPYYSVDSSTWVNAFRYGAALMTGKGHAKLNKMFTGSDKVQLNGRDHKAALAYGCRQHIVAYQRVEKEITGLWERRGVKFAP